MVVCHYIEFIKKKKIEECVLSIVRMMPLKEYNFIYYDSNKRIITVINSMMMTHTVVLPCENNRTAYNPSFKMKIVIYCFCQGCCSR